MFLLEDNIDFEIEEDKRKFIASQSKFLKEDSIFLSESDKKKMFKEKADKLKDKLKDKKANFNDNKSAMKENLKTKMTSFNEEKSSMIDSGKEAISNAASSTKESAIEITRKFKDFIQEVKNDSVKENEERILKNDLKMTSTFFSFMTKFAICSVICPIPIISGIVAIIGQYVHNKKIKKEERMKFYANLRSDYALLDSKIKDLENKDNLSKTEAEQKYKLIKLREMTKMNMHKLEYMVNEDEDR